MKKQLIAITGLTCSGKTTLKNTLLEQCGDSLREIVTTTTRKRRVDEDVSAYRFCSERAFKALIEDDELLEWVKYDSRYYGIERRLLEGLQNENRCGVVVATQAGLAALECWCRESGVRLVRVLVTAHQRELARRLDQRSISEAEQEARREEIRSAKQVIEDALDFDWVVDSTQGRIKPETIRAICGT